MTISREFMRFLVVGTVGFAVDGGMVWVLVSGGMDPLVARCFSFPMAVLVTWWLNREWTFTSSSRKLASRHQIAAYIAVQLIGGSANFVAYAAVLSFITPTPPNALMAFALGSALGLIVNFTGAKWFVFAPSTRTVGTQATD